MTVLLRNPLPSGRDSRWDAEQDEVTERQVGLDLPAAHCRVPNTNAAGGQGALHNPIARPAPAQTHTHLVHWA